MRNPPSPNNQIQMVESKMVNNVAINMNDNDPLETEKSENSPFSAQPMSKINVEEGYDKPDYTTFKSRMAEVHARNSSNQPYSCHEACCNVSTGWHCCCSTTQKSEIDKFGVGVVQYFRFVKYFVGFFFLATILSIPVLYFCIRMSYTMPDSGMRDFKDGLFYTTLGAIATGANQCSKVSVEDLRTPPKTLSFSCALGNIGAFSTLNYGRVTETLSITCEYYTSFSWDKKCNNANQNAIQSAFSSCEGQKSCSFDVVSSFFDFSSSDCQPWDPTSLTSDDSNTFYFQILCENIEIELPGGYSVEKELIGWIVASFDAAISILFLLFLLMLKVYEKKTIKNVLGNNEGIEAFSIEVRSLPTTMTMADLKAKLWSHFSSLKLKNRQNIPINVVDVQLAESNALLAFNTELGLLKEKKIKVSRKFYKKWSKGSSPAVTEILYEDLQSLAQENGKKALKDFKSIEKLKAKQDKLEEKIDKLRNVKNSKVISAFITFESKYQRDLVYSQYQKSPLKRCCFSIGCCKYKNDVNFLDGKYLKVTQATDPSNIIWENMNVGSFNKFLRRMISWGVTLLLWIISFVFMNVVRTKQNDIADSVQPIRDCSVYDGVTLTIADVEQDMALGVNGHGMLECYCRLLSFASSFQYPCTDWARDRVLMTGLPFVIVFVVLVINIILQYVFKFLSAFEKHRSASTESVSKIVKIFVAQALNTGIIILIVNARFAEKSVKNLFEGTFDDVTPEWFWTVATTILITMIINVINVPVVMIIFAMIRGLSRCCDRGCTFRKDRTKKKTQHAWENLYTGPEFLIEFRYSQILTMVFVSFFYSSGVPLLYASTFINLLLFYWLDKICLLRLYRLPKNFDHRLQALVRKALYFALLLHLGNAVWTYGQEQIFGGEADSVESASSLISKISGGSDTPNLFAKLLARAVQSQNISLSIIFIVVLVGILLKIFFESTLQNIYKLFTKKKSKASNPSKYGDSSYFNKIKKTDLDLESKYLEKEMAKTRNEDLKNKMMERSQKITQELSKRPNENEKPRERFPGIFSYNIGHNPNYKRFIQPKTPKTPQTITTPNNLKQ